MSLDGARGNGAIDDPDADEFMHFESGVATASYRALIAWASQSDMLEAAAAGLSHLAWKHPAERAAMASP